MVGFITISVASSQVTFVNDVYKVACVKRNAEKLLSMFVKRKKNNNDYQE